MCLFNLLFTKSVFPILIINANGEFSTIWVRCDKCVENNCMCMPEFVGNSCFFFFFQLMNFGSRIPSKLQSIERFMRSFPIVRYASKYDFL